MISGMPMIRKKNSERLMPPPQLSRGSRSGSDPGTHRVILSPSSSAGGLGLSVGMSVVCHEICHAGTMALLSVVVEAKLWPLELVVLMTACSHEGDGSSSVSWRSIE